MGRLLLSCTLVAVWLGVLLAGWVPALLAHTLLVAALVTFPWRALREPPIDTGAASAGDDGS